jgi:excisionase family DNA binding protein
LSVTLISAEKLGKVIDLPAGAIRRMAREGKIPAHRYGKYWRFNVAEVLAVSKTRGE